MPEFLCVLREPEFSPGRVEDDAAILLATANALNERGYSVEVMHAAASRWPKPRLETIVLSMAQGDRALEHLAAWESEGVRVVNSVRAVRNCRRIATHRQLVAHRIPQPPTRVCSTAAWEVPPDWLAEGVWIKRGDLHAMVEGDVSLVHSAAAAAQALRSLQRRGVNGAVVQRHVPGTVVKFYGVGEQFFYTAGKFLPVSVQRTVAALARRAAVAVGLEVFGGDCVLTSSGQCLLVDLNDWPSYAPCRAEAALAIAAYVQAEKARGATLHR
jgi:hypothetical protein